MRPSEGGTTPRLVSISIPPLLNAPFTATVTTIWSSRSGEGTTDTVKNRRTIARDSAGHIFQERRQLTPDGDKQETAIAQLEISDPTTHQKYFCHPGGHDCERPYYSILPFTVDVTNGASASDAYELKSEDLGSSSN
jgi:hypothetical protein